MADTILNYLIKAEWQGKDSARKAKQDIEGLGKTGITARNGLLELQAGLSIAKTALGVAGDAAQEFYSALKEGAQLEVEREKFDALANSIGAVGDALLGDLQAATGGMVTNSDLVRGATDLMNLGLVDTADETVRWATAVSSLNLDLQVLGLTLANDSTARLDSLGLSMGTVNQKTETFIALGYAAGEAFDMAVLEALEEKMELFGDKSQTTAGKLQILETSWANITDRAKVGLAEGMAPTIESLDKEINLWDQLNEARDRGAEVTLVSGPSSLAQPQGILVMPDFGGRADGDVDQQMGRAGGDLLGQDGGHHLAGRVQGQGALDGDEDIVERLQLARPV